MKTIIEPFRIKVVEPIRITDRASRERVLRAAHYNLFQVKAEEVTIDLLTDSGTAAMSSQQWSAIMAGDESYAGSRSFYRFEEVARALTGFRHIIPVHQGRAAEKILFGLVGGPGKVVPSNSHFDTTRANVEYTGATALDLLVAEGKDPVSEHPFKGNIDLQALQACLEEHGPERVPLVMLTVTNNSGGGQPVSLENIRAARETAHRHGVPLFLDACRFAENAYFIKLREPGQRDRPVRDIAREMFSLADGCTMSAKKDGLVNIGGFLGLNDDSLASRARNLLILIEGFPTYGGLAGRDLEAMAQGLTEVLDEDYLNYRFVSTAYLGDHLKAAGVPILLPVGGHAVYLDARRFVPHIPPETFPAQAVACELYLEAGIRSVEIGSLMFGKKDPATGAFQPAAMELVRLAIPRRVYTQSHIDYVIEAIIEVHGTRRRIRGYDLTWEAPYLRHFTARLQPRQGPGRPECPDSGRHSG
jgi:tryptophanase